MKSSSSRSARRDRPDRLRRDRDRHDARMGTADARQCRPWRVEVRKRLADSGLKLTALMENLPPEPPTTNSTRRGDGARLRKVVEMSHDLVPDSPPLIQTVLGGGKWDAIKTTLLVDRAGRLGEAG